MSTFLLQLMSRQRHVNLCFLNCEDLVSDTLEFGSYMGFLETYNFLYHIHYLCPTGSQAFWIL